MHVKISAIEYSLPSKVETEKHLSKDNPKWNVNKIISATGIKKRYTRGIILKRERISD